MQHVRLRSLVALGVVLFGVGAGCHTSEPIAGTYDLLSSAQGGDLTGVPPPDLTGVPPADLTGVPPADLTGGVPPSDLATTGPLDPVDPMTIVHDKNESNFIGDEYGWIDALGLPRSALMTHNTQQDPQGHWGGLMRRLTYQFGGGARACVGTNGVGHPGFGKIISHYASTSTGSNVQGTHTRVLEGRHHAIHQYQWNISFGGTLVKTTVHWFFANGRSHPAYAVTYDTSALAANAVDGDTRSPYGDLQWDYGNGAEVTGVGWGDHYKFKTLGDPVCKKMVNNVCDCASGGGQGNGTCWTWDGWDYSQANTVPYALAWADSVDAEMGLVQSQTRTQHDGGSAWFYGNWGTTDNDGPMPEDYNWAYQILQYSLPYNDGIRSKRLAWGMNVGAVGQNSFNAMGDESGTLDGYPYQSYMTYVVLNAHSLEPTAAQVTEIEHNQGAALTASVGTVRTQGPAGVARTDEASYAPVGFNPIYGTWEADANNNDEATLTMTMNTGAALVNPVFAIHGYGAATAQVRLDGALLTADAGYFATIDADTSTLWLTLRLTMVGTHTIAIAP